MPAKVARPQQLDGLDAVNHHISSSTEALRDIMPTLKESTKPFPLGRQPSVYLYSSECQLSEPSLQALSPNGDGVRVDELETDALRNRIRNRQRVLFGAHSETEPERGALFSIDLLEPERSTAKAVVRWHHWMGEVLDEVVQSLTAVVFLQVLGESGATPLQGDLALWWFDKRDAWEIRGGTPSVELASEIIECRTKSAESLKVNPHDTTLCTFRTEHAGFSIACPRAIPETGKRPESRIAIWMPCAQLAFCSRAIANLIALTHRFCFTRHEDLRALEQHPQLHWFDEGLRQALRGLSAD